MRTRAAAPGLHAISLQTAVARLHTAVLLLGALLVCAPPCLVGLVRTEATNHMEVLSLVTSQETWLRQKADDAQAWSRPTWNGELRVRQPPLTVWVHLLAWSGLPTDAPVSSLVARARAAPLPPPQCSWRRHSGWVGSRAAAAWRLRRC